MHDLLVVGRSEAISNLLGIVHRSASGNRSTGQQLPQAFALQQFGDKVRCAVLQANIEDR
jgi:hypothetical protein